MLIWQQYQNKYIKLSISTVYSTTFHINGHNIYQYLLLFEYTRISVFLKKFMVNFLFINTYLEFFCIDRNHMV